MEERFPPAATPSLLKLPDYGGTLGVPESLFLFWLRSYATWVLLVLLVETGSCCPAPHAQIPLLKIYMELQDRGVQRGTGLLCRPAEPATHLQNQLLHFKLSL